IAYLNKLNGVNLVCQEKGGHLMTVRTENAADVLGGLLNGASGDFWLGLKYAGDQCSNSNDGLKGYRWVTGDNTTQYVNWKSDLGVCSPLCVSVSQKVLKWTERACNDRIEGYLCEYDNPSYCPPLNDVRNNKIQIKELLLFNFSRVTVLNLKNLPGNESSRQRYFLFQKCWEIPMKRRERERTEEELIRKELKREDG
uniref:C-type lectin domain-containing protein n=1 Tax=Sinocyclocheilus grahami TaxID=75366 RepID=A0A672PVI0_SINGR